MFRRGTEERGWGGGGEERREKRIRCERRRRSSTDRRLIAPPPGLGGAEEPGSFAAGLDLFASPLYCTTPHTLRSSASKINNDESAKSVVFQHKIGPGGLGRNTHTHTHTHTLEGIRMLGGCDAIKRIVMTSHTLCFDLAWTL